jgi:voltage-gated potassium channel
VLTYGVMSLVTASIAAFFIGKEEKQLRREMHQEIKVLRHQMEELHRMLAQITSARDESRLDAAADPERDGA